MAEEIKKTEDEIKELSDIKQPEEFIPKSILANVKYHLHNGVDSPKIDENDIGNAIDKTTVVLLTTDQTIAGVKTFSSIPVLPASDPTADNEAARKAYVDSALGTLAIVASDNIRDSADASVTEDYSSYTKIKEIKYNELDGDIRVHFKTWAEGIKAKVYINGIARGIERTSTASTWDEWDEDFSVETDDLIQLYAYKPGGGSGTLAKDFRLKYDKQFAITPGTVNQD